MERNGPKILLVDDDKDLLQLIALRLRAAGYAVRTAESAEAALASLSAERPHLVVSDLRMQGMDGLALFDAIRREAPDLPVVILTAHGTIPEAVDATSPTSTPEPRISSQPIHISASLPWPGIRRSISSHSWRNMALSITRKSWASFSAMIVRAA